MEQRNRDFVEFYERSRDDCLRVVFASVGDRQLAEELVSEAFARAWASWRKVSRHPAPRAWIVRTALNTGVSWWRRRRREVAWNGQDLPIAADATSGIDAQVLAALWTLPTRQREVIVLRVILDLDTQTTAETLGIAAGTVRAHLHRATSTLRDQLISFKQEVAV